MVTETGYDVLTSGAPKLVKDVEAAIGRMRIIAFSTRPVNEVLGRLWDRHRVPRA